MASSGIPESPDMMVRFMRSGEIFTPSAPIDNQALFAAIPVLTNLTGVNELALLNLSMIYF
jgi:hypothetical protein